MITNINNNEEWKKNNASFGNFIEIKFICNIILQKFENKSPDEFLTTV